MGLLNEKVAIVTGAGSGIGRATVLAFAREGARVLAVDISGKETRTVEAAGPSALAHRADVSDESAVKEMVEAAVATFGGLDILCNVAGIGHYVRLSDTETSDFDKVVAVNLYGTFFGMKHAIPQIAQRGGGAIVNWSSVGGLNASDRGTAAYSATKFGVVGLTKVGAVDHGAEGIRVNCICPGFVTSENLGAATLARFPNAGLTEKAALKRAGTPEEVAEVALFLASERASYVSGAIIPVDGGWSARLA